jgi:uncharacterized membrane protein
VGIAGILTSTGVGWAIASLMPSGSFDPEQIGAKMSSTAPKLIDMFAALMTGIAGAFAVGGKDVSDTLPGVAIAISLDLPGTATRQRRHTFLGRQE